MFERPNMSPDWLQPGVEIVCLNDLLIHGINPIKRGDKGTIHSLEGVCVNIELESGDLLSQLRIDFVYYWTAAEGTVLPEPTPREKVGMIVSKSPDGGNVGLKAIGYWASNENPEACRYKAKGITLPWPGDFVDPDWDLEELQTVAAYLDIADQVTHWRGFAPCRLCTEPLRGSTDKSDGVYVWPADFSHYLLEHFVRPPQEFIDHVLSRSFKFDKTP